MLSCKDIARKTMSEEPYTFKEKIEFKIHMFICATCRVYLQQMENFDKTVKKVMGKKVEPEVANDLQKEILKKAEDYFPKNSKD
jgi:hypothetical protein